MISFSERLTSLNHWNPPSQWLQITAIDAHTGGEPLRIITSGLPVIVTAVGGNPELVQHSVSGWWVPVADESSLVKALLLMQSAPALRKRLAQNARMRVQQFFTIEIFMAAVTEFYRAWVPTSENARTRLPHKTTAATVPD